ncbi:MAG TPA: hypothetical protein VMB91_05820 [Solirubrobacteraceae bacterium]|nr:hypothetical protein [Solirubrobacteraceae bacterium]
MLEAAGAVRAYGRATWGTVAAALSIAIALVLLIQGWGGGNAKLGPASGPGLSSSTGLVSLPADAWGPVSATVGAHDPAYRLTGAGGALTGSNPDQRLSLRFDRSGAALRAGGARLGLELRGLGYGASLTGQPAATAEAQGSNRVAYRRGGVSEWYVNGPLGLEQGFTVARPPARGSAGPLTLSIATSGNLHASLAPRGRGIRFAHSGRTVLVYGNLSARDARGRPLHSWLGLSDGRILLHVDTDGARFPVRIDPFVHQDEKLVGGPLVGPYGYIGNSVALSADGNTALVGAPADGTYTEYKGAAFVFTRSGSTWTQQGEPLTGGGETGGGWFGESVALSADGDTAVTGAPSDDEARGAAWVFTRSGSTWTQQGEKLTGGGEVGDGYFGKNVALSGDGDTALVGGYNDNEHKGAAWVFTRSGANWTQEGEKLTGSGEPGFFGWGVALSGDGGTALVGEWGLEGGVGAAWVFTRSGSSWSKQGGPLTAAGEPGEPWFGYSTALSANGNTAVIGAPHADGYAGAAWVYTRSGSTWTQQGPPLTGGEEVNDEFGGELGYSAALSAGGNTALLGGRVDSFFHGAAWAFARSGSTWTQDGAKLTGSEETANREEFGWSVALSSSGQTALVGSPCEDACVGSSWVFVSSQAAPEFGSCVKGEKGSGAYANAGCTKPGGSGRYAWSAGVSKAGFTTSLKSGSVTLETVGGSKLTCTGEAGTGEYAAAKSVGGVVLVLTGCSRSGTPCSSSGAQAGEIVTSQLEGTLGVEKLGVSERTDKLGLDLSPSGGTGSLAEFTCGATSVAVRGSVIGSVTTGKTSVTSSLKFKASKGRQKPEGFAGGPTDVLEESLDGGAYEQAGLTLSATQLDEEPVEANPAV